MNNKPKVEKDVSFYIDSDGFAEVFITKDLVMTSTKDSTDPTEKYLYYLYLHYYNKSNRSIDKEKTIRFRRKDERDKLEEYLQQKYINENTNKITLDLEENG